MNREVPCYTLSQVVTFSVALWFSCCVGVWVCGKGHGLRKKPSILPHPHTPTPPIPAPTSPIITTLGASPALRLLDSPTHALSSWMIIYPEWPYLARAAVLLDVTDMLTQALRDAGLDREDD